MKLIIFICTLTVLSACSNPYYLRPIDWISLNAAQPSLSPTAPISAPPSIPSAPVAPSSFNTKAGAWSRAGDMAISAAGYQDGILKADKTGVLYLFYRASNGRGNMKKFVANTWTDVGASDFTVNNAQYFDMAFDSTNKPYVVFSDNGNSGRATVKRFNGTSWVTVGAANFTDSYPNALSLALDPLNDTPYVAYSGMSACSFSSGTYIKKFDGTNWVNTGGTDCVSPDLIAAMVVDTAHNLYAAATDWYASGTFFKFNGTTWTGLPAMVATPGHFPLALDSSNKLYTASNTSIFTYDGTTWVSVGPAFQNTDAVMSMLIKNISGTDRIYAQYTDSDMHYRIASYNGSTWDVYSSQSFNARSNNATFDIDANGAVNIGYFDQPFLDFSIYTFAETTRPSASNLHWSQSNPSSSTSLQAQWTVSDRANLTNQKIQVYNSENCTSPSGGAVDLGSAVTNSYNITGVAGSFRTYRIQSIFASGPSDWSDCSSLMGVSSIWNYAGGPDSFEDANGGPMQSDSTGKIYNAFRGPTGVGQIKVWNGSTWSAFGGNSFSGTSQIGYFNFTLAPLTAPNPERAFVVYSDTTGKLSVRSWDGTSWNLIGAAQFTAASTSNPLIAVGPSGTPYVSYAVSGAVYVMKYTPAGGWAQVGSGAVGTANSKAGSIFLDASEGLHLAYIDGTSSRGLVQKFNGTAWITLGSVTSGTAYYYTAKINPVDGLIYAAYEDNATGLRATMLKWDGTSWSSVGSTGFSSGTWVQYVNFDFDSAGLPYVAFVPWGGSYPLTVMHFDGNSWSNLGTTGFTNQTSTACALTVDRVHDKVYVQVQDGKLDHVVRRYDP